MNEPERWEYQTVKGRPVGKGLDQDLAKLGRDGWRVVQLAVFGKPRDEEVLVILERPVRQRRSASD